MMMIMVTLVLFYGYLFSKLIVDEQDIENPTLTSLWLVVFVLLTYLIPTLLLVATGLWFVHKGNKRMKKKKKPIPLKKWNFRSFELFASHCERQLLYWQKGTNPHTYQAEWDGWQVHVEVANDLHILRIQRDDTIVSTIHYYGKSGTFGKIHHEEDVVNELKKALGEDRAEKALAYVVGMMADKEWKEQLDNPYDEVAMMKETDQLIQAWRSEELTKEYKRFTHHYIENIQYELHMSAEEKKAWKQSLHLLLRVQRQDKEEITLRDMRLFVQSLADGMEKLHERLTSSYRKVQKETIDQQADY